MAIIRSSFRSLRTQHVLRALRISPEPLSFGEHWGTKPTNHFVEFKVIYLDNLGSSRIILDIYLDNTTTDVIWAIWVSET